MTLFENTLGAMGTPEITGKESNLNVAASIPIGIFKTAKNYYDNIRALTGIGEKDTAYISGIKKNIL